MRAHAETHGDRLKVLLLLVDAVAAPPPPRLVNKWSVRRIHEADDAVVHTTGQFGSQVGDIVHAAETRDSWHSHGWRNSFGESRAWRRRLGNKHPNIVVMLFAGIRPCINAVDLEVLVGGERGDELALSAMGIERPAVVAAFELLAVEVAVGKRHAAVRTSVAQGEDLALTITAENQGSFEQHRLVQAVAGKCAAGHCPIPETEEHLGVGGLAQVLQFRHS